MTTNIIIIITSDHQILIVISIRQQFHFLDLEQFNYFIATQSKF